MLKKVVTDQRSDLSQDSINSLLAVKVNYDGCCTDAKFSNLLKSLKKAARVYYLKHSSCTAMAGASSDDISSVTVNTGSDSE